MAILSHSQNRQIALIARERQHPNIGSNARIYAGFLALSCLFRRFHDEWLRPQPFRTTILTSYDLIDLSKLVNNLKTVSSRLMRKEYAEHLQKFYWSEKPMFWSGSYALISVGTQAPLEKLIQYVQN